MTDELMTLKFEVDFDVVARLADWMSDQTDTPASAATHAAAFIGQVMGFMATDEASLKEGLELIEAILRMIAWKALEFRDSTDWRDQGPLQ